MNDDFVLFNAETYSSPKMIRQHYNKKVKIDKKLPSGLISAMEKGNEAVRSYWNNKNLRGRVI